MARSRVRKQAKEKKSRARTEKAARDGRIRKMENWYKELEDYENQALARIIDRAAVEEGETDDDHSEE